MENLFKNLKNFLRTNKSQLIIVMVVIFFYWIVLGVGKMAGENRALIKYSKPIGEYTIPEIKKIVSQNPKGEYKIFIQEQSGKFISDNSIYTIKNFKNDINNSDLKFFEDNNVKIDGDIAIDLIESNPIKNQDIITDILMKILITSFYAFMAYFIYIQVKGAGMGGFGKRFNIYKKNEYKVTFSDVAGHIGPKKEVTEAIDYLKHPEKYQKTGAKPIKGILLFGPPGNGKTLIAKSIAGEADANFIEQNAASFVQLYVGAGAMAVRNLFAEARKQIPCVIFIDEIDAVGGKRGGPNSHDEKSQTVNALLSELDGFADNNGIVVIAATNRLDELDEALIRPGRFDRKVMVPMPGRNDRFEILKVHSKKIPNLKADIALIADKTQGFSGADLANLINEAAIEAARDDKDYVDESHIIKARDRILMGTRNYGYTIKENERKIISYHEAGHAILGILLDWGVLEKITILPHGMALGATIHSKEDEQMLLTKHEMEIEMLILMGGRAAEEVFCGAVSTGASNDMQRASKIARDAIFRYGFDVYGPYIPETEAMYKDIELAAAEWLKNIYIKAKEILMQVEPEANQIVTLLLENDEIYGETAKNILKKYSLDKKTLILTTIEQPQ